MKNHTPIIAVGKDIKILNNRFALLNIGWLEFFCVFLFSFGAMSTLHNTLGIDFNFNIILMVLIFSFLCTLIFRLKRFSTIAVFGVLLGFIGVVIAYIRPFTLSVYYLNQLFLSRFNQVFNTGYNYYLAYMTSEEKANIVFLIPIVLAFLICFITASVTANRKMTIVMLLFTCIFLYMEFFLSLEVNVLNVLLISLAFAINYALRTTLVNMSITNKAVVSYKDVFRNHYVVSDIKSSCINVGIVSLVVSIIFCAVIIPFVNLNNDDNSDKSERALTRFTKVIDYFSTNGKTGIDSIINSFAPDTAFGGIAGDSKLGQVNRISFKGKVDAVVTGDVTLPLYLKGYVGEVYNNSRWTKKSDNAQEKSIHSNFYNEIGTFLLSTRFEDFLYKMSEGQDYPYNQLQELNIKIKNPSIKYLLQPYFLNQLPGLLNHQNDDDVPLNNLKEYSAKSYIFNRPMSNEKTWNADHISYYSQNYSSDFLASQEGSSIITPLGQYYNYTTTAYTQLPDTDLSYLDEIARKIPTDGDFFEIAAEIKKYLSINMEYDISPGRTPLNVDFAEHFLTTSKKGYCTHFATSGALLLRYLGIPTRYVEGYTIFSFKELNTETGGLNVVDSNAHAWVEIYDPLLGWVPFDMTPPSSVENPPDASSDISSDMSSETSSVSSDNSSEVSAPLSSENSSLILSSDTTSVASTPQSSPNLPLGSDSATSSWGTSKKPLNKGPTWVAFLIIGILLVIAIIVLTVLALKRYRKLMFTQPDRNKAVIEIYSHIQKWTAKKGVTYANDIHKYAENVEQTLNIADFIEVTDIVLKARFSKHTITEDEYLQVLSCFESLK